MNPSEFWKNFRLGEELHISGTFIYNGLRRFHEMRRLDFDDELFEFLYNLSIGLERLLKITLVLHEHAEAEDQEKLEQSLITHSHLDLLARIRPYADLRLGPPHNELLSLLGTFYKTLRYDRFSLHSVYQGRKEARAVRTFLTKHLQAEFPDEASTFGIDNADPYRRFIQRTTLKIAQNLYKAIEKRAGEIGLYTYELRNDSRAESVFLRNLQLEDEDAIWKELLVFFMNTETTTGYLRFLRSIPPLAFDPALVPDYLDCFKSDASKASAMDELEHHYECMDRRERKDRLECIRVIGSPYVYFDDDEVNDDSILENKDDP